MCRPHLLAAFRTGCILGALFSLVASGLAGPRPQASQSTYTIDTLIVVDEKMYSRFEKWMMISSNVPKADVEAKIKEYVSLSLHQVNAAFATIKELPYTIRYQLVNMTINENVLGKAAKGNNSLAVKRAQIVFANWLRKTPMGKYDNAILLTGYKLDYPLMSGMVLKGRAFTRVLCTDEGINSALVIEEMGFQSWRALAHELGHVLGSDHDGEKANVKCSGEDNYIMAAIPDYTTDSTKQANAWRFSSCSAAAFDAHIKFVTSSRSNCLSSTLTPMPEFTATANVVAGQRYPKDVQCQMVNGPDSRTCLGDRYGNLDEICTSMYCLKGSQLPTDESISCLPYFAAEGTTCGNKKWCRLGKCVEAAKAPAIPKECPNGDSVYPVNNQFCPDYVKSWPGNCYSKVVREHSCCSSCLSARRPSKACPYGDKVVGCEKYKCRDSAYKDQCCGTCKVDKNTTTPTTTTTTTTTTTPTITTKRACVDVPRIDGVPCSARVAQNGLNECYNTTVAARCCLTCSQKLTNITGCKYGDYYQGSFCDMRPDNIRVCFGNKRDCCASCWALSPATSNSWSGVVLSVVVLCGFIINTVQSSSYLTCIL